MAISEPIIFSAPGIEPVKLLVNPETLTLQWKKVYSRVRTKARIVTLFWGEEPVRFAYQGQTGYVYPTFKESDEAYNTHSNDIKIQMLGLTRAIHVYEEEIYKGGPYYFGSAERNEEIIIEIRKQLKTMGSGLVPRTDLVSRSLGTFTNTQLLYLSEKFKVLKRLESLYSKHRNPEDALMTVTYRDYILKGYFESFSYTDDAKNPWNWIYDIEITILDWEPNVQHKLDIDGEIIFAGEDSLGVSLPNAGLYLHLKKAEE